MKLKPLIFLFTFVYNDRKHINKLFESIKRQSSNNFIYYLYDDHSDESYNDLYDDLKIELAKKGIKSYFEKGKTNLGVNKATEHCLLVLRNKFKECTHFVWINSDDWLSDNAIERFSYHATKNPDCAIYMSNIVKVHEKTKQIFRNKNIFKKSKNYIIDSLYNEQIYNHFMVNAHLFFSINPNGIIYNDNNYKNFFNDIAVLFLAAAFNLKTCFINEYLTYFLFREDSASSKLLEPHRNKILFFHPQEKYVKQINTQYTINYLKIVRISFTHIVCRKLLLNREFKKSKLYYKNNKILFKQSDLKKEYLYPCKSSKILYFLPRFYYFLNSFHALARTKKD